MALSRVSITIPRQLVTALDKKARELSRSRSWVLAEAARVFLGSASGTPPSVSEPAASYAVRPGLGEYRQQQLEADLRLTPAERVRAAERTARATPRRQPRLLNRVISFDRYEDYLEWERKEDLLG